MSRIKTQTPIIHTPSFKTYTIYGATLRTTLDDLGLKTPMAMLDKWYYYTDTEGWGNLLPDLLLKSDLYQSDKFDCDNFALKAMTTSAERYELNTMDFVIGDIPEGRHAFNMIYTGEDWLVFEPNIGFQLGGQAFPIGENGYKLEMVLV